MEDQRYPKFGANAERWACGKKGAGMRNALFFLLPASPVKLLILPLCLIFSQCDGFSTPAGPRRSRLRPEPSNRSAPVIGYRPRRRTQTRRRNSASATAAAGSTLVASSVLGALCERKLACGHIGTLVIAALLSNLSQLIMRSNNSVVIMPCCILKQKGISIGLP